MHSHKNTLIIYSANPDEIYNRKSAIGSYIFQLSECLKHIGITTNVASQLKKVSIDSNSASSKVQSILKHIVPEGVKLLFQEMLQVRKIVALRKEFDNYVKTNDSKSVVEFYNKFSNIGSRLKKKYGLKYVVIYDGPIDEEYKFFTNKKIGLFQLYKKREKDALESADTIIVYSQPMKEYLCNKYNQLCGDKIKLHQNVDFSRLHFFERTPLRVNNIGFIGSFLKWHRVDILINVFNKLKPEFSKLKLHLIGSGQMFECIKEQVNISPYKEDIIVMGFLDGDSLYEAKKKIDIGVMPSSVWYNAPNKIFEYGAMQMAVVAPSTPTIADLFQDNKNIVLFNNNDEIDLYEKLYSLLQNEEKIEKLKVALYKTVCEKYTMETTLNFYRNIL